MVLLLVCPEIVRMLQIHQAEDYTVFHGAAAIVHLSDDNPVNEAAFVAAGAREVLRAIHTNAGAMQASEAAVEACRRQVGHALDSLA